MGVWVGGCLGGWVSGGWVLGEWVSGWVGGCLGGWVGVWVGGWVFGWVGVFVTLLKSKVFFFSNIREKQTKNVNFKNKILKKLFKKPKNKTKQKKTKTKKKQKQKNKTKRNKKNKQKKQNKKKTKTKHKTKKQKKRRKKYVCNGCSFPRVASAVLVFFFTYAKFFRQFFHFSMDQKFVFFSFFVAQWSDLAISRCDANLVRGNRLLEQINTFKADWTFLFKRQWKLGIFLLLKY